MNKMRKQVENGEIPLNPYPTSIIDYHGNYEQINLYNKKRGINIFVTKYSRKAKDFTLPDEYIIEGDIPVKSLQVYNDIERINGCKIEYTHEHQGEWTDLHPKCVYYKEIDFFKGLSELWKVINQ